MADTPEPEEQLVKVFDTDVESEALVVQGLLQSGGIDAIISNREAPQDILPGVGGVVVLIASRHGIAVAAVHDDPPPRLAERVVGPGNEAAAFDFAQPNVRVPREALGSLLAFALQRQIDVVVVDEHRAETGPTSSPLHL